MNLKIAIIGTRGIPNNYGGFEQVSEFLSKGLLLKGHEITVYNSHNHPYQENSWKGVNIVHCYDPEYLIGTAGQFIYDFNCIMHARRQKFDVLLFMGYTSSSIWARLFPKETVIISNMDGLEWKRDKYSKPVKLFLRYAEKWAVENSHFHIADSKIIQLYLQNKYNLDCSYIPYGATISPGSNDKLLNNFKIVKQDYYLIMARMEPENNVNMVMEGFHKSTSERKFVVIGNIHNRLGTYLRLKYQNDARIIFTGGIFDKNVLDVLRTNCYLYFHGHSTGGTNPSLLEAMAKNALIAAHSNDFNKAILGSDAYYFSNSEEVKKLVEELQCNGKEMSMTLNNQMKIESYYSWENVIDNYNTLICQSYNQFHQKSTSLFSSKATTC